MEQFVHAVIASASNFGVGLLCLAAVRVIVSQAVGMAVLIPLTNRLKADSEGVARRAVEADVPQEERDLRGCVGLLLFIAAMLGFTIWLFATVWSVVLDVAPPGLARTAGWLGAGYGLFYSAWISVQSVIRERRKPLTKRRQVSAVATAVLLFVPAAGVSTVVYVLAPVGVVLYSVGVFVLAQIISRMAWRLLGSGSPPASLGII